ncbi:MAG: hypothetical protein H7123_08365 [Thermoleophilia bacterium]|nr:hypothetical protein [Thermoleophilia bacterium]
MSVNGIPAGYSLPFNSGIPAGFVPAAVQPYAQGQLAMSGSSNAALGAQTLGQRIHDSGMMSAIRNGLAHIGIGGGGAPMPQMMTPEYLPQTIAAPAPAPAAAPAPVVVAKPRAKVKPKAKHRAHKGKTAHHAAKPKPAVVHPPAVAGAASQTLPLTAAGANGYVGSLPFGGIAGGIGAGGGEPVTPTPQVNATNQSALSNSHNPLEQHVTNDNTYTSEGSSNVEAPYGTFGGYGGYGAQGAQSMYGGTGPVLGWNNPLGYEPMGGYGASMSGGNSLNLDTTKKPGFFSRLFGG